MAMWAFRSLRDLSPSKGTPADIEHGLGANRELEFDPFDH